MRAKQTSLKGATSLLLFTLCISSREDFELVSVKLVHNHAKKMCIDDVYTRPLSTIWMFGSLLSTEP